MRANKIVELVLKEIKEQFKRKYIIVFLIIISIISVGVGITHITDLKSSYDEIRENI